MKKVMIFALAMMLVLTALVGTAFASETEVDITFSVDKTSIQPGDDVTLTIKANNKTTTSINTLEFYVSVPEGFTYKTHSVKCGAQFGGDSFASFNTETYKFGGIGRATNTGEWTVLELTLTASENVADGEYTFGIDEGEGVTCVNIIIGFPPVRDDFVTGTNTATVTVAHAHDCVETLVSAATCTAPAKYIKQCSVEGCEVTDGAAYEKGSALGHKYTNYVSDGNAKCEQDGTKTASCDNGCGTTDTVADEGSALSHKYTDYVSDGNAKCEQNGTKTASCDNGCGEKDTVTDEGSALGHKYTDYKSNNDATCEKDGTETASCDNGCGKTDTRTNEGSALGHDKVPHEAKTPTCTDFGWYAYETCTRCDYTTYEKINDLGHEWVMTIGDGYLASEATCTEKAQYYFSCKKCGVKNEDYTFAYGEVNSDKHTGIDPEKVVGYVAPTCTEKGQSGTGYCEDCKTNVGTSTVIEALGHKYTNYVSDGNAKCEQDGTKTAVCDNGCGEKDTVTDEGSALSHKYTDYKSNNDATCEKDGTKTASCDNGCGEKDTVTDEGSALGHKYTDYKSNNDATCTEDGTKTAECDNGCGTKDTVTDEGSARGHKYTDYKSNNDATCTEDGTETAECDNGCGEENTRTDDDSALGHDWKGNAEEKYFVAAATCTKPAEYYVSCSRCGEAAETSTFYFGEVNPDNHTGIDPEKVVGYVAPTCTEGGQSGTGYCEDCKTNVGTSTVIEALGHKYTNYVSDGNAKCEQDGTKTAVCDNGCGEKDTVTDEGSALSHKYTDYKSNNDATCEKDGTKTASCDNGCGEKDTVTDEGSALGHEYAVTFTWNETADGYSAAYEAVCSRDASHKLSGDADVTKTIIEAKYCDELGEIIYTASVTLDGKEFTEKKAVEGKAGPHIYDDCYDCDENGHWNACGICKEPAPDAETEEHTYDMGGVFGAVDEDGNCYHYIGCDVCGYEKPDSRESCTFDDYSYDDDCHWAICGDCGQEEDSEPVKHTMGEWETQEAATATEDGWAYRECTVCEYGEEKILPATGTSSNDSNSSGSGSETKAPPTGDDANIALWAVLFVMAGAGAVVLSLKKKEN